MTHADAEAELDGLPLVPASAGSIKDMKALRDRCLAAGIPALVGCDRPGSTWGTRTHLLVEEDDYPKVQQLLRGDWHEATGGASVDLSGEACPACGCTLPLVEGACADCGLQLE